MYFVHCLSHHTHCLPGIHMLGCHVPVSAAMHLPLPDQPQVAPGLDQCAWQCIVWYYDACVGVLAGFGSLSYWYDAIRMPSDCNPCRWLLVSALQPCINTHTCSLSLQAICRALWSCKALCLQSLPVHSTSTLQLLNVCPCSDSSDAANSCLHARASLVH